MHQQGETVSIDPHPSFCSELLKSPELSCSLELIYLMKKKTSKHIWVLKITSATTPWRVPILTSHLLIHPCSHYAAITAVVSIVSSCNTLQTDCFPPESFSSAFAWQMTLSCRKKNLCDSWQFSAGVFSDKCGVFPASWVTQRITRGLQGQQAEKMKGY